MENYFTHFSFNSILDFYKMNSDFLFSFSIYLKGVIFLFLICILIQLFLKSKGIKKPNSLSYNFSHFVIEIAKLPLFVFINLYCLYLVLVIIHSFYPADIKLKLIKTIDYLIEFVTLFWCIQNFLHLGKKWLVWWFIKTNNKMLHILFNMISNSLQAIVYLIVLNILLPQMGFTGLSAEYIQKTMHLVLIVTIGWILIQILNGIEQLIINKMAFSPDDIQANRKIITQVKILKKVFVAIGLIIIIAAMLMVFDSVRSIGAGLLTTAGIVGAAGAFASQKSLAGLFSGLNLAFTQPIRIGDTIVIDKESGQVEEITLSYVVIKLWDLRRLILPTDYFMNKGVVNLTRNSTELVGAILFYVDYTLHVDALRKKFNEMLAESELWDKKSSSFQVTDLKEQCVEIRALVSAKNLTDLWNLRCEIREKLLKFIVDHFPSSLPKTRQLTFEPS